MRVCRDSFKVDEVWFLKYQIHIIVRKMLKAIVTPQVHNGGIKNMLIFAHHIKLQFLDQLVLTYFPNHNNEGEKQLLWFCIFLIKKLAFNPPTQT